ncbi:MAG TPA: cytochrome c oxidase subunit II transmembrane domain-containing protein, partial [Chthoniobacteraceae bacterium]|nr:cytochrome c oxidase subunit II transmembrane domain-containing protein [Chthoniobacteraceae bacterium]
MNFHLLPPSASANAGAVDALFWALTGLSVFICMIVFGPIAFFVIKYRRGSKADRTPPKITTWKYEVTWTAIPLLIGLGICLWAAVVFFHMENP